MPYAPDSFPVTIVTPLHFPFSHVILTNRPNRTTDKTLILFNGSDLSGAFMYRTRTFLVPSCIPSQKLLESPDVAGGKMCVDRTAKAVYKFAISPHRLTVAHVLSLLCSQSLTSHQPHSGPGVFGHSPR